jgi:uncharacterized membrane protein YccC
MRTSFVPGLRGWFGRAPNQIAVSTGIRGVIATGAPLVILPAWGEIDLAHFAVIGALGVSMVDVGGPYRRRLAAMAVAATLGPCLLLLGLHVGKIWWLAASIMAVLAVGSGLVRAFGPGGISFGINMSVAFLIGVGSAALEPGHDRLWAGGYVIGSLWTILVTLAFWHVRPYRRLEQEVAGAWQAVADLVAAVRPELAAGEPSSSARRRHEQTIVSRHRAAREAIERAHDVLGEARAGTSGQGTTMAQLVVLVASASRIGAAMLTLSEIAAAQRGALPSDPDSAAALRTAIDTLADSCRVVARVLLAGRGEVDVERFRQSFAAVAGQRRGGAGEPLDLAFAQALRNLVNAEEAVRLMFDHRRRLPSFVDWRRPTRRVGLFEPVRSHITFNSVIFRHALRVAAVASLGTAISVRMDLAHGFWLPMTALVVLQPEYGGTLSRAVQRSAGTVAGALLAGVLLVTLHGTIAFELAIAALLFATFFLLRRHYGQAMAFMTPLIILLVGFNGADPWLDVVDRILYTLAGAAAALIAGYALWPQWERERLPDRLAAAIRAGRRYVAGVLEALEQPVPPIEQLGPLRRAAEVQTTNLEAAFQRLVAEPAHQRGRIGKLFMLTVYAHRLCRHAIALEAHIGAPALPRARVEPLQELIVRGLDDVAAALEEGRAPAPRPPLDQPLARLRDAIAACGAEGSSIDLLLGQIVSDLTNLNAAAASIAAGEAAVAVAAD